MHIHAPDSYQSPTCRQYVLIYMSPTLGQPDQTAACRPETENVPWRKPHAILPQPRPHPAAGPVWSMYSPAAHPLVAAARRVQDARLPLYHWNLSFQLLESRDMFSPSQLFKTARAVQRGKAGLKRPQQLVCFENNHTSTAPARMFPAMR